MKILLLNYEYPPLGGGAATACRAIAREFAAMGIEPLVFTSHWRGLPTNESDAGIRIVRVPVGRRHADRGRIAEMLAFLAQARLRLPDLVRHNRPHATLAFFSIPGGPPASFLRRKFGIPYVVSLRGGDVPGAEPGLAAVHRLLRPFRRRVLREALAVVANSEGLRAMAENADPMPVQVIPNGIDLDDFQPAGRSRDPSAPFRFLFAGRFQSQKNLPLLLDSMKAASGRVELHLAGGGPMEPRLRAQADALGLADRVQWHGWIPRDRIARFYQSGDCLVHPSSYEGMPNTVLEAMACGLPVIATDVPGNRDVVAHRENGLLIPAGSTRDFTAAIDQISRDRSLAETLGRHARDSVARQFSWRSTALAYAALLEPASTLEPVQQ